MSSLQTPTRGRVHSQEDVYFTPTSAHISRFQLRPKGQHGGSIPFVLPSVKPGMTSGGGSFRSPSRADKESTNNTGSNVLRPSNPMNTLPSPQADRTRPQSRSNFIPKPTSRPAQETGFNIHPDLPPRGFQPSDGSPLKQSFKLVSWTSPNQKEKPRMGRRSLTFPMTAGSSGGSAENHDENENENAETGREEEQGWMGVQIGSPVRRRVNSDRPGSAQTRSPLRAIHPSNPPGTPTPAQTYLSPTPQLTKAPLPGYTRPLSSIVPPPPTPSGGLRRKSKFIAKSASRLSFRPVVLAEMEKSVARPARATQDELDVETDSEPEVDAVERGVVNAGSWVSEAFGEDDDALIGASQECAASRSQRNGPAEASQDIAVASQTLRKSPSPPVEAVRRSARLSAGRTSASPRPDHYHDLFEVSHDSFVSAVSSSSSRTSKISQRKQVEIQQDLPAPPATKPATPKPSVRRRKRSSDVATVMAGSVAMAYESPNPRAKKNARKSVLVVEIPTASRLMGSPMRGVVRTSVGRSSADPVTPQRNAPVKRAAPATDKPASKESRRSIKSGTDSPPASQGRAAIKGRKSLGAQIDGVEQDEEKKKTISTSKRRKGRKSLAPAFVMQNLQPVMDYPLRPSSPTEDPLLLVGSEEPSTSRRGLRKSQSSTPRPGKDKSRRKSRAAGSQRLSDSSSSTLTTLPDEAVSEQQETEQRAEEDLQVQTPHSPVRLHDVPPRTSSPAYPEFREYSPPNDNWQSIEFSGFGPGACDSSPPPRAPSTSPPRHEPEPSLSHMDFTLATASTPLKTPISKRRISTPHHGPIPSSTPARSETDRAGYDQEAIWEDVQEEYASEGEYMANDRDSSPAGEDAGDATAQCGEQETERGSPIKEGDSETTLPAAEESDEEEEEEEEVEQEENRSQVDIPAKQSTEEQPTKTDGFITIRTVVIKTEASDLNEAHEEEIETSRSAPEDGDAVESDEVGTTSVVMQTTERHETFQTVEIAHNQPSDPVITPGSANEMPAEDARSERTHKSGSEGVVSKRSQPQGQSEETASLEVPESHDETHGTDQVVDETEISLGEDDALMRSKIDEDYTRAPITISSQDPRAAALAAAILRRSRRYIEASAAPPPDKQEYNKLKRRRSQYFATAESAAALTPDELLREAELELYDEKEENYRARSRAVTTPGVSNEETSTEPRWNRDDWAVLNRCYRRVKRSVREKGKSREGSTVDELDVDKVIDSFVFKKGITQEALEEGKWARRDLAARIVKLHRNAQRKSAESRGDNSLSSTERGSIAVVPGPASPIVKKTRTGETTSRATKVEVHVDKEFSETPSGSGSGWWGSMSKTWSRIKSSVSLSSMVQDGESPSHEDEQDEQDEAEEEEEEEEVLEIHPRRPFEKQARQERPVAPRPRRALPGGLASLPIDTPVQPQSVVFRGAGQGTGHFASPFVSPLVKNANATASGSRSNQTASEMKQVGGRGVSTPSHQGRGPRISDEGNSGSQRSTAIKALFATGANSPHFSAIPARLSGGNRPSPLSQSQPQSQSLSQSHIPSEQPPRRPITIPRLRASPESEPNTSSPSVSVRDLVRSFEEAAHNRSMMSSSTEGDISLDLGGRGESGLRWEGGGGGGRGEGEGFRRKSGLGERSL